MSTGGDGEVALLHQLAEVLPRSVYDRIHWVYQRRSWEQVEVAFDKGDGTRHVVIIPNDQWLSDVWIARLCLEAP